MWGTGADPTIPSDFRTNKPGSYRETYFFPQPRPRKFLLPAQFRDLWDAVCTYRSNALMKFSTLFVRLFPLLLLLLPAAGAQAQVISLFQIDPSAWPTIRGSVLAVDADGNPVILDRRNLRLTENGTEREITLLDCPEPDPVQPISSVLAIDISSSMRESGDRNLTIARTAAHAWIDGMPLGLSECAITSFTTQSFLNQDFTINARKLSDAVDNLRPDGGTNYNGALISPVTGAIPVATKGKHKRVIVFLTDGRAGGDENEIVRQALAADITIHCITIGFDAPPILKNIAQRTGGLWFENVRTPEEAAAVYRLLLSRVQGGKPCRIEWTSAPACDSIRDVTLEEFSLPASTSTIYTAPPAGVIRLDHSPRELRFGVVPTGSSDTRTIRLSAPTNQVTITSVTSSDPRFTIETGNAPPAYTIPGGSTQNVTVRYTPTDESYVYAEITIRTLDCPITVYAAGGKWGGSQGGDPPPEIRLTHPNGGERFPVGIMTELTWTGVLPTDTVTLDYSIDGGSTWIPITSRATGLAHPWRVPNTPSETCLARVRIDSLAGGGTGGSPVFRVVDVYRGHTDRTNGGEIVEARFLPQGRTSLNALVASASDNLRDRMQLWRPLNLSLFADETPAATVRDLDVGTPERSVAVATDLNGGWVTIYRLDGGTTSFAAPDVTTVALQKNGNTYLATGHGNGDVRIWRTDGTFVRTIAAADVGLGPITALESRPNAPEFAVGGNRPGPVGGDDTVKIFGTDGRLQEVFPRNAGVQAHADGISSIRFSPDGSRFVVVSNDAQVNVWPRFGGTPALRLSGHNDAAFNSDGSLLVVGEGDLLWSDGRNPANPKVYNAQTGALFAVLQDEHRSAVTDVDIIEIDDVTYILTAGLDSTVVIWEMQSGEPVEGGPGVDVSDNLWAIIAADLQSQDVDFGIRPVGTPTDSVVRGYLRNPGEVDLLVERMTIGGTDRGAFEIMSALPPFTLPAGGSIPVEFRFTPDRSGPFSATVQIISAIDTLVQNLSGQGVAPLLGINASIVDFGLVEVGDVKDSVVLAVITNLGTAPLTIERIEQAGPDFTSFTLLDGDAPFTLPAGGSHTMRLQFTPRSSGGTTGSLRFHFDGPDAPATVLLFGTGFCPSELAAARASVADAVAGPGDTVAIDFRLDVLGVGGPGPDPGLLVPLDFSVRLSANGTILTPVDEEARLGIEGGRMQSEFSGRWDPAAGAITWSDRGGPRYIVGLGNAEQTDVSIEEVIWQTGCPPDIALGDATFTLDRLCRQGDSVRLFNMETGTLKLEITGRNPARERIDLVIETIEEGRTQLLLVDMEGREMRRILDANVVPGSWGVGVDVRGIASGNYLVLLQTPTARILKNIIIQR